MKRVLLSLLVFTLFLQNGIAQCGSNATFVGSTSLISGSGNGSPGNPYTAGSVVRVTVTVGGTYNKVGSNWWHGIQVNLGSDFTFASPLNFSRTGFPGGNSKWIWNNGMAGNGPGAAGPGIYYDDNSDGDPSNGYGVNTSSLSGTFRFNILVTGSNTTSASITANITPDGFSGAWNSSSCDADALISSAQVVLNNIALPVTIVSIKARNVSSTDVELDWETATEQNVSYFNIEFSSDGATWNTVGSKAAAGNSSTLQQYSFIHKNAPVGERYYRIKSVDRDGRMEYSKVVSLKKDYTGDYLFKTVYPNPAKDKLSIQLVSPESSAGTLSVYNAAGVAVIQSTHPLEKGLNELSLNVSSLQAGIYLIQFTNEHTHISYKLVKQ